MISFLVAAMGWVAFEGTDVDRAWLADPQRSCHAPQILEERLSATRRARAVLRKVEALDNPRLGSTHRYLIVREVEQEAPAAANRVLEVGELYLKGGCPDQADEIFRDFITRFTGDFYSAYRERALVGIADVRALKEPAR